MAAVPSVSGLGGGCGRLRVGKGFLHACTSGRSSQDTVAGTAKDEADRAPSSTQPAETPTRVEAMRAKIKAGGHASPYRLRKQLPEPVFGLDIPQHQ
jgi:hypothetical protein